MAVIKENNGDAAGNAATQYSLTLGDVFEGTFNPDERDTDWVRVELIAGTIYDFSLSGYPVSHLYLLDADGNYVLGAPRLIFTPEVSGVYYVEARPDDHPEVHENYTLSIAENRIPVGTYDELADYLAEGHWGQRFYFNVPAGGAITVDISGMGQASQQLARWALDAWSKLTGLKFEFVQGAEALITFTDHPAFTGSAGFTAQGEFITASHVNVPKDFIYGDQAEAGSWVFSNYLHEIGHALGLGHPGPYPQDIYNPVVSYGSDNIFLIDSEQATVMSYFSQTSNSYIKASSAIPVTPMIADIIAIQQLYGTPESAFAGDTIYGVGANTGGYLDALFESWTTDAINTEITLTLYDTDGRDTLDLSTDVQDQHVDLRPEAISDVFGLIGNLVIAHDTLIENYVAGGGNDHVLGNRAANNLRGGDGADKLLGGAGNDVLAGDAGADILDGGAGSDTASYRASDAAVIVNLRDALVQGGHAEGDTLVSIENLTGSVHADTLTGDEGANVLNGGAGADTLDGGAGSDTVSYRGSDGAVVINLATGIVAGGDAEGDVLRSIENIAGSAYADTLAGDDGDNVLTGSGGADSLIGGGGADTASWVDSPAGVTVRLHGGVMHGGDAEGDRFGARITFEYTAPDGSLRTEQLPDIEHLTGSAHADILAGDARDNRLAGGPGADTLYGGPGGGADILAGEAGDDRLYGGLGADSLEGGPGNDTLSGGAHGDRLAGGPGADLASWAGSPAGVTVDLHNATAAGGHAEGDIFTSLEPFDYTAPDGISRTGQLPDVEHLLGSVYDDALSGDARANRLNGGAGNDRLAGREGADELQGNAGDDELQGGADNDTLSGGSGADHLDGGAGDDLLIGGSGADRLAGGPGLDIAAWITSPAGVTVDLETGSGSGGDAEADTLQPDIEWLRGSAHPDTLRGNGLDNRLEGGSGADQLSGRGGADVLYGGLGDDELNGGTGNDMLVGGPGADRLSGGPGTDTASWLHSAAGVRISLFEADIQANDIEGDSFSVLVEFEYQAPDGSRRTELLPDIENLIGTNHEDILFGDARANHLTGAAGDDHLYGHAGDDVLAGGAGRDWLFGEGGADILTGGSGDDTASWYSSPKGVTVDLSTGNATGGDAEGDSFGVLENFEYTGTDGSRQVVLVADVENLVGSGHADTLVGDVRNNWLTGHDGDDTLRGNGGDDYLSAGAGDDTLHGGVGRDILLGQAGDDTLHGGPGDDSLHGGPGADTLSGGSGANDSADWSESPAGVTVDLSKASAQGGNAEGDTFGNLEPFEYTDSDGIQQTVELPDIEVLFGSAHNDTLTGDARANFLEGYSGNDNLHGGPGADVLSGGEGDDVLHGDAGADELQAGAGADTLFGGPGDDQLFDPLGDSLLDGGPGDDALYGGSGDDELRGGNGADMLYGEGGNDMLHGGDGADVFVFFPDNGADEVVDFAPGEDMIKLSSFPAISSFADLDLQQLDNGVLIDLSNHAGGSIILEGLTLQDLSSDDFLVA